MLKNNSESALQTNSVVRNRVSKRDGTEGTGRVPRVPSRPQGPEGRKSRKTFRPRDRRDANLGGPEGTAGRARPLRPLGPAFFRFHQRKFFGLFSFRFLFCLYLTSTYFTIPIDISYIVNSIF